MRLTIPLAALVVLALTGCTPPSPVAPEPTPTETVAAAPSATPTPMPEPTVAAPAPDFGFTFYGDIQLGDTFAEHSVVPYPECSWMADLEPPRGTQAFSNYDVPTGGIEMFISSKPMRDALGIGPGSTLAEVIAAYPQAVISDDGFYVTIEDPDSDSRYAFSMTGEGSTVDVIQWGPIAGIQWGHLCSD